uniref:Uncharacterized protein n=1 Tax=Globodera rostochiensis TaxID=31243 RepID=A0A914HSB9_GLORO
MAASNFFLSFISLSIVQYTKSIFDFDDDNCFYAFRSKSGSTEFKEMIKEFKVKDLKMGHARDEHDCDGMTTFAGCQSYYCINGKNC